MHKIWVYALTLSVALIATIAPLWAQTTSDALIIVKNADDYRKLFLNDSLQKMVEVKSKIVSVLYDLKYATKNNFTGRKLYSQGSVTYLRLPAVQALARVQHELLNKGYSLKIFDAYRPYSITRKMWDLIRDERYVANPAKGSGHNRGLAVDLTIIDLNTGKELNMGTPFDNFTDSAHHNFMQLPEATLSNRKLLKETMLKHGFNALETEWWHYSWPNDRHYGVLDLSFKELNKLQ